MKAVTMATITALAVGGVLVVSNTTRTTPGVTFSNRLTPAKDGRVIRSTVVPKATWRGGQTWTVTITRAAPAPVESLTVRAATQRTWVYADTIWAPFPTCATYRVTVKPDTVLTATGRVSTRKDSLTARLSLCRPYTVAEAADLDSFPGSTGRIHICRAGQWVRPDTSTTLAIGDSFRLAVLDTNRYTGRPRVQGGATCPP